VSNSTVSGNAAPYPNFRSLKGKSFILSVDILKSSLHLCKFYVCRDLQAEALQQDLLMLGGAADTSFADRDASACGQHNIDQGDLL